MEDASTQEKGHITRAVAEIADAVASGEPLDPNSPAIRYCRNFGAREAAGEFDSEYKREAQWSQKQGCTCRAKPQRSEPGGGFTTEHLQTCGIIAWREQERAERADRAKRIQEARQHGAGWVRA